MYGQNGQENNIMAYAKFTPRNTTTNNSYDVHYMTKSIQDFLQGTNWTTQSDASGSLGFNGSAGTVAGTYPTSGIYSSVSVANQSTGGELSFYKKHYAHSQFTGDPQLKVVLRISSSDGWRIHIYDRNGSNISPNTNVSTGIGGSTTAYMNAVPPVGADYGQVLDSVHIIANDTTFAIKIITGGGGADNTPTTTDHGWMVLNDIEYNPTIDLWAYGIDNTYCPSVYTHAATMNVMSNPQHPAAGSNYAWFGVTQPRYIDATGVVRTGITNAANGYDHGGLAHTTDMQYSTFNPQPNIRQDSFAIAGSDTPAHMLTPLTFIGQHRLSHPDGTAAADLYKNPRRGRLMNFYRTTDDCANDGNVILEGSTRYRIMKGHMTGNAYQSSAENRACYAFPEDNVPYA